MGADCGISESVAHRHVKELEAAGLIRRTKRLTTQGRQTSNTIEFLWLPLEHLRGVKSDSPEHARGAVNDTPEVGLRGVKSEGGEGVRNDTPSLVNEAIVNTHTTRGAGNDTPGSETERKSEREGNALFSSGWDGTGWDEPEDFEAWWTELVRKHPNKNRNAVAKTKAVELIERGDLKRAEFEEGYSVLATSDRWTDQNGRYVPNLYQFFEDRLWKFTEAPETGRPNRMLLA